MKKTLPFLCIVFALLLTTEKSFGQSSFGVSAGFHDFTLTASLEGMSGSGSNGASGYYVGFFGEFGLADKLKIQPEIQFAQIFSGGGETEKLFLPVMFKYYVAEKFNLQAGPTFDLLLANEDNSLSDFGFGIAFGGAFDITQKLAITTKYSLGLNNRTSDPIVDIFSGQSFDVTTKFDVFQVGLAYKF
ncbi:outer membrane beta-barrel protein [Tenacibaculum amylolyticum]|uniref:outer membrane beta-barrel protein n=1 Tax=Tenacibaculum amylolyticum TaxID=104269 RepID=UPI0038965BB9